MLKPGNSYEKVYSSFRWNIPEYYNIGVDIDIEKDILAHMDFTPEMKNVVQMDQRLFWKLPLGIRGEFLLQRVSGGRQPV